MPLNYNCQPRHTWSYSCITHFNKSFFYKIFHEDKNITLIKSLSGFVTMCKECWTFYSYTCWHGNADRQMPNFFFLIKRIIGFFIIDGVLKQNLELCTYTLYICDPVSEKSPLETNKFHESLTSRFSSSEIVVSAILFDVQPIVFSAVKNKSPFNCTNSPIFDFIFRTSA